MNVATREPDQLYEKYTVTRNHDAAGKHQRCAFFVLDLTHDPIARRAATWYASAVQSKQPGLASDLRQAVMRAEGI